jgi:predicted PurR-regulated permease PerM
LWVVRFSDAPIPTFYLLVEAATPVRRCCSSCARATRARVPIRDITLKVSAWLGGQLFLGAIIDRAPLGLLIGVPSYVLALISGVGELIPVVGPILRRFRRSAVASTVSLKAALFVISLSSSGQQVENHLLVPKIMARQVGGRGAVTVIVSLLIGGKLLGISARAAVPTAAILQSSSAS